MSELIDIWRVIELLSDKRCDCNFFVDGQTAYEALSDTIKAVKELPRIDLVRCEECKHWDGIECQNDRASTDLEGGAEYALYRDDTDFCSYGERRAE